MHPHNHAETPAGTRYWSHKHQSEPLLLDTRYHSPASGGLVDFMVMVIAVSVGLEEDLTIRRRMITAAENCGRKGKGREEKPASRGSYR